MQTLYRVKSSYYLAQAKVNFEYSWFVYKRSMPVFSADQLLQSQPENKTQSVTHRVGQQILAELFTLEEAEQLQALLAVVFDEEAIGFKITTSLEEVTSPANLPMGTAAQRETYQASGHYVDPYDFALLENNNLGFMVAAAINCKMHYVAEDFLRNLSPERLAALRKMHQENNG